MSGAAASAQETGEGFQEEVTRLFLHQRRAYPQEKAYLHLDRNHYISGDTVWFNGYIVDAVSHFPDTISRYLYVDLVNPADSLVSHLRVRTRAGGYPGHIPLPPDLPEGEYTVWAYTLFMQNKGRDYFFRTPLRVTDPRSVHVSPEVRFTRQPGSREVNTETRFVNAQNGTVEEASELIVSLNQSEQTKYPKFNPEGYYPADFHRVDTSRRNVVFVDSDKGRRYVEFPARPEAFDVTFHPEGGQLIAGVMNNVGFKALNVYGQPEHVAVQLYSPDGEKLGDFEPLYQGMGVMNVFPLEPGEEYYAVCTNDEGISKRFTLPGARGDAVSLKVVNRDGTLYVSASRSPEFQALNELSMLVHVRGNVLFAAPVGNGAQPIRLDTPEIPSGVCHILLLDQKNNILSERLVYVRNDDQARVRVTPDRPAYGKRAAGHFDVALADQSGEPLQGRFSVAVTDDRDMLPDTSRNIYTELLLNSDLRGYIDSPAWYFNASSPDRVLALDALMLTQGWRRYDLPALLRKELEKPTEPLELSMVVSGQVKTLRFPRPAKNTPVYLTAPSVSYFDVVETDDEGRFSFQVEFPDSVVFLVRAGSDKNKNNLELILDEDVPVPDLDALPGPVVRPPLNLAYVSKADRKWILENGMRTIYLDAISVTHSQFKYADGTRSPYSGHTDRVYDKRYLESNQVDRFADLFMREKISFDFWGDQYLVFVEPDGPALIVVDDVPCVDSLGNYDPNAIAGIDPFDMFNTARVEVLNSAVATTFFGRDGRYGALLIYTRQSAGISRRKHVFNRLVIEPQGYQKPVEFYSPRYETAQQRDSRKQDLRTTVYWNPSLTTDEQGQASFEFYMPDENTPGYSLVIEGVTDDGRVIRSVEKIRRQ